jgi:hypothetical protein
VIPLFVATNLQTAYGAEIDPIVGRWNFSNSRRGATYFEMAGGIVYTNQKIPPGDTSRFNVVPSFGFGWQFFRREQQSLDVGVHAWHLSNAWTAARNPSSNGIMITIGYHWFAPKLTRSTLQQQVSRRANPGKETIWPWKTKQRSTCGHVAQTAAMCAVVPRQSGDNPAL